MQGNTNQTPGGSTLSKWLDYIQQESWQLELVISGFVLFLLLSGYQPIVELEYDMTMFQETEREYSYVEPVYYLLRTAYLSLILCLIVHVVLRGVWIAAVGLRSVSGDIDYDALRFQDRFRNRLRRRMGSFDDYIARLERNCSVIFSLAFLLIFCFLSLAAWMTVLFFTVNALYWMFDLSIYVSPDNYWPLLVIIILFLFCSLAYLVDFVSLGFLKRNRWTARPYYYVYVFMGWITLARFYRPLYYNLIDNSFGRRLAFALPLIMLGILLTVSLQHERYDYFGYRIGDGKIWLDADNYDDEPNSRSGRIWRMSLASRYATNNYVQAFIPYRPNGMNERLRLIDSTLVPIRNSGFRLEGVIQIRDHINYEADEAKTLRAFGELHRLYVNDSLYRNLEPLFHYDRERDQAGVAYMIPVHHLPVGRHELKLSSRYVRNDSLLWSSGRTIYFYK